MNKKIQKSVKYELEMVKQHTGSPDTARRTVRTKTSHKYYTMFIKKVAALVEYLADSPQSTARSISKKFHMKKEEIKLAYTLIQRSKIIRKYLNESYNGDYFTIVNHYFNNRMLVIVFFVGLSCPCRCLFCPNVLISNDGTRKLVTYNNKTANLLDDQTITAIFRDIAQLKKQGINILVKISGGLEPFTDTKTMTAILDRANAMDVPVKIYTNGVLLDSKIRREIALKSKDIRISLSSINEQQYNYVLFGNASASAKKYSLQRLMINMDNLVDERNSLGLKTQIGINTVILEENHRNINDFILLAKKHRLDYIDFKPNYFLPYTVKTRNVINRNIKKIKKRVHKEDPLHLYFADSLSEKNIYWKHKSGYCQPHKQKQFKLFISPHGQCTPVHYGAFPTAREITLNKESIYICGQISSESSLLEIINNESELPSLENSRLNPFELMLSLEVEREESDRKWGIPFDYSPYRHTGDNFLPAKLTKNRVLQHL